MMQKSKGIKLDINKNVWLALLAISGTVVASSSHRSNKGSHPLSKAQAGPAVDIPTDMEDDDDKPLLRPPLIRTLPQISAYGDIEERTVFLAMVTEIVISKIPLAGGFIVVEEEQDTLTMLSENEAREAIKKRLKRLLR